MAEKNQAKTIHPHPEYQASLAKLAFFVASHKGGPDYLEAHDENAKPILVKIDRESQRNYNARRAIATVRNLCGPVVNRTNAYIFGRGPTKTIRRPDDATFLAWAKDVDGDGLAYEEYIQERVRASQVRGWSWAGLDARPLDDGDGEGDDLTEGEPAQPESAPFGGLYAISIDPENVIDWAYGEDGTLERFAILESCIVKGALWQAASVKRTVRLWRLGKDAQGQPVAEVGLMELAEGSGWDVKIQALPPPGWPEDATHNRDEGLLFSAYLVTTFPELPFVRFDAPGGLSQIAECAHSQRRIVNLKSWGDNELGKTFSTIVITGASDESVKEVTSSKSNIICIENADAGVTVVGADSKQADSIRSEREMEEKEVARGANLEASYRAIESTGVAESGEKRKRDLESLYQQLQAIAGAAETAERAYLRLLARLAGLEEDSLAKDVSYPNEFDVKTVEELQVELRENMALPFVPDALLRRLMKEYVAKAAGRDPNVEELLTDVDSALPPNDQERFDLRSFVIDKGLGGKVDLYMSLFPVPEELAGSAKKDGDGRALWDPQDEKQRDWVKAFLLKVRDEDLEIAPAPIGPDGNPLPPDAFPADPGAMPPGGPKKKAGAPAA